MHIAHNVQQCLVVMASAWLAPGTCRRIIALLQTYQSEVVKLLLLVVGKMSKMRGGVLERLDARQVRHGVYDAISTVCIAGVGM